MDIENLRDRIKLVLAQADAENDGNATNEQRADALLNAVGLANDPERIRREVSNVRFGRPGEFPRVEIEAATLSDLIAQLIGELASRGDLPLVMRGRNARDGEIEQSAVWRRTKQYVTNFGSGQFDWSCLLYSDGPVNDVGGLPDGTPALTLETEG